MAPCKENIESDVYLNCFDLVNKSSLDGYMDLNFEGKPPCLILQLHFAAGGWNLLENYLKKMIVFTRQFFVHFSGGS